MLNRYDWKNIFKKIIIGVGIAFILFNINKCNAYAYVNKGTDFIGFTSGASFTGTLGNSNSNNSVELRSYFNSPVSTTGYDLLGFPFYKLNFDFEISGTIDNPYLAGNYGTYYLQCVHYDSDSICDRWSFSNSNSTFPSSLYFQDHFGTLTISGQAFDTAGHWTQCVYEENPGQLICPVNSLINVDNIKLILTQTGYSSIRYDITYFLSKNRYNYESTEIVDGLSGIQNQQSQTNTIIQDSNVSGASSSGSNSFSNMNSQLTQQADSLGGISTYNNIASSFVNQLSTTTCQAITLPFPFVSNQSIVLPCIGNMLQSEVPVLWTFWRMLCAGIVGFSIWKSLIKFVKNTLDPYHIGAENLPIGGGK